VGEILMLLGVFSLLLIMVNPILGMIASMLFLVTGGGMACKG